MKHIIASISLGLSKSRHYILSIFITYCVSCSIGILMSHLGSDLALSYRDKIVGNAVKNDRASINYQSGNNFKAALYDCTGNILYAAVPQTVLGFGVILPYFSVTYQGWVGGIVSVDNAHQSRFKNFKASAYYLIVLLLQFIPFSISIGSGVRCGVDFYKHNTNAGWKIWNFRLSKTSLQDLGYAYILCVPLFFIASLFEFLSAWNI